MNLLKSSFHTTKTVIIAIILICIIDFMVSNRGPATIGFFPLPFTIETRLFVVMIACFLLGLGCGLLLLSRNILKNAISNWKIHRKIKRDKEVDLQS